MTLAITIQARLGSTRFPAKVTKGLAGRPMLEQVVARAEQIWPGTPVWVLVPWGQAGVWPGLRTWEGDEHPLWRYHHFVSDHPEIQTLMRLTGDCPLLDPGVARLVLQRYYVGERPRGVFTAPTMDGLDVEVFDAAEILRVPGTEPNREHVTPWLRRQTGSIEVSYTDRALDWSVDEPVDLDWAEAVYQACPLCAQAVPRHTNAGGSIGGGDRHLVLDLHHTADGGLAECRAADLLWSRATQHGTGGQR